LHVTLDLFIVEISIAVLLNARDNIVDTLLLTVTYSVLNHMSVTVTLTVHYT